MLKKRDLQDVPVLFELLSHPDVFPYVREKATTLDEFYFLTKQTMEAEENGYTISRTITDQYSQPIGVITLYDLAENYGFLATWIGRPYFRKGYNRLAKEHFFKEVFSSTAIDTIFMKIRQTNIRSYKAALKIPYVELGNHTYQHIYKKMNQPVAIYDLFAITKSAYLSYKSADRTNLINTDENAI
ncbi:MAG TPA: GNAT family N-acetyltransferase [Bacillota bacterium]|nr:GNAT family N-acetyltransferase [Bacillota bacterium]